MLDIVLLSYETAKAFLNGEPKLAMLSYSTKGSAESQDRPDKKSRGKSEKNKSRR